MSQKPHNQIKRNSYPYRIPSLEHLKERLLKKLEPAKVQEFCRIEALLRSKKVANLYEETFLNKKPGNLQTDSLYLNYLVFPGWAVLNGCHHDFLTNDQMLQFMMKDQPYCDVGIIDLQHLATKVLPERKKLFWQNLKEMMDSDNPRNLYLEIDASYPTKSILNVLRKLIAQKKEQIKSTPDDSPWFRRMTIKPNHSLWNSPKHVLNLDAKTWIDYFRCYDLRYCKAKTFGEIAMKVYGASNKYEVAEHAYKRVIKLIEYAESNNWPPPPNFLNKK